MEILRCEKSEVRDLLLKGNFGLEKESLRVTQDGFFAHTMDPFGDIDTITRDFCENQTEINTPVHETLDAAFEDLRAHTELIQKRLVEAKEPELLWPFSNPPYINRELDVPIAQFYGDEEYKTEYREYLSERYGRYKMALCGIHFNYSFSDELLQADYESCIAAGYIDESVDFADYKSDVYLKLAEMSVAYGWIVTAITAASPVFDASFVQKGALRQDAFAGMGSMRGSELGYWNFFSPALNYSSADAYADSINRYVDANWIKYPSELYYPIRLKPRGTYNVDALHNGISHIELRMIDLNPLRETGVEVRDLAFCQLLLVWLACTEYRPLDDVNQMQATANFKNAAHFDLETVKIVSHDGKAHTVGEAARSVINSMRNFYSSLDLENEKIAGYEISDILFFEFEKFVDPNKRYAWKIREEFGTDYVIKGIELARKYQQSVVKEQ